MATGSIPRSAFLCTAKVASSATKCAALQTPEKMPVLRNVFDVRELALKNKSAGSGRRKAAQQAS
jgi:hypothetical protein